MNCLKGRRHAHVGDGRSQAVVRGVVAKGRCCYQFNCAKASIRKRC